jgi:hypothetical protein
MMRRAAPRSRRTPRRHRAHAFLSFAIPGLLTIQIVAAADGNCPRPPGVPPGARYSCPTHTQTYQPGEPIIQHPGGAPGRGRDARDPAQTQPPQSAQQPPRTSAGGVPFLELPAQAAGRRDDFSQYGLGNVQCVDLSQSKYLPDRLMQNEQNYNCFYNVKAWMEVSVPRRGLTGGSAMLTEKQLAAAGYRELVAKPRVEEFFARLGDVLLVEGTQSGVLASYPYVHAAIVIGTTPQGRIRTLRQKFDEEKCVVDLDPAQFTRAYGLAAGKSYRLWRKY